MSDTGKLGTCDWSDRGFPDGFHYGRHRRRSNCHNWREQPAVEPDPFKAILPENAEPKLDMRMEGDLSAEQFYADWLAKTKFTEHPTKEQIYHLLRDFAALKTRELAGKSVANAVIARAAVDENLRLCEERSKTLDEAAKARLEGRLVQFERTIKLRPIDPAYWDMHEEESIRSALLGLKGEPAPKEGR